MAAAPDRSDSEDSYSQNTTFYRGYGNDSFNIYYNNVQSLCLHLEDLYHESSEVQAIAATETWLGPTVEDNSIRINGFQSVICKDRPGDAHGGVALYIRNGIISKRREDLEITDLELMWNEVVLPFGKSLLGVLYQPPNSPNDLWKKIEDSFQSALDCNLPVLIMGDINCDILCSPNKIQTVCDNLGITIMNSEATHIVGDSQKCIDIVISSTPQKIEKIITTGPAMSNHSALITCLKDGKSKTNSYKPKVIDYKRADWLNIKQDFANLEWPARDDDSDLDNICNTWTEMLTNTVEKHTLTKTIKISPWDKKWLTKEVKKARKKRDRES